MPFDPLPEVATVSVLPSLETALYLIISSPILIYPGLASLIAAPFTTVWNAVALSTEIDVAAAANALVKDVSAISEITPSILTLFCLLCIPLFL